MANKLLRIIRPLDKSAEYEYIKEFFHFVGCFTSNEIVDAPCSSDCISGRDDVPFLTMESESSSASKLFKELSLRSLTSADFDDDLFSFLRRSQISESLNIDRWKEKLRPEKKEDRMDVVINFIGRDPYLEDCHKQGIKRVYCYFDFEKGWGEVSDTPILYDFLIKEKECKSVFRLHVLNRLIDYLWQGETLTLFQIKKIARQYAGDGTGRDLFYFLQVKKSLRLLNMNEILSVPEARISSIPLTDYLAGLLEQLWSLCCDLQDYYNIYCRFVRIHIQTMMHEIVSVLNEVELDEIDRIVYGKDCFGLMSPGKMLRELREICSMDPDFMSAQLLMAKILRSYTRGDNHDEHCYLRMLYEESLYAKEYAFIRYRIGHLYEKKYGERGYALKYYQEAVEIDADYYPAIFKIGYFKAAEGRVEEAEWWLSKVIHTILQDGELNGPNRYRHHLALKECQYLYKTYMLLAKIAINGRREHTARQLVLNACLALGRFEDASIIGVISEQKEYQEFSKYHRFSSPIWSMWKVLEYWGNNIVCEPYVDALVSNRMQQWKTGDKS